MSILHTLSSCMVPIFMFVLEFFKIQLPHLLYKVLGFYYTHTLLNVLCEANCNIYKIYRKYWLLILKLNLFQLIIFGGNNQDLVGFMDDNVRVFERILLQNSSDLFSKQSVYFQINNIQKQVSFA